MDYTIYIDSPNSETPFMDIIFADSLSDARRHAIGLLRERPHASGARLHLGDYYRETIGRDAV